MSHTTHPGLDALWLTEAVRLREEQAGPLEDSEAVRQALAQGGSLPRRILTRAHWLGRREGLLDAQRTWRQGSRLALALLLVLALASGAGLAFAALGDGQRPVNVFWALASLLGLHLLTLLGWALGLLAGGEAAGALAGSGCGSAASWRAMPAPRTWRRRYWSCSAGAGWRAGASARWSTGSGCSAC